MVELSLEVGVNEVEEQTREVVEDSSKESVAVVVSKATTSMVIVEAAVVHVEGGDLVGKIMTNHNGIVMPLSTLSLTGKCLRRSTSTAWLS